MKFDWDYYYFLIRQGRVRHSIVGRYLSYEDYPCTAEAFPTRLCETGCYYTGYQDEVKCHHCTFTYSNWNEGDIPEEKHRLHSPECQFLIGDDVVTADTGGFRLNDRLINIFPEETIRFSLSDFIPLHERPSSRPCLSNENKEKVDSMNNGEWNIQNAGAETKTTFLHTDTRGDYEENADGGTSSDMAGAEAVPFEGYDARLRSFKHWLKSQIADPQKLAQAGFYFTGRSDIVRCYRCKFELRNLEVGIDPLEEHERLFPFCDNLLQNRDVQIFNSLTSKRSLTNCLKNTHGRDLEETIPKERQGRQAHYQKKGKKHYGLPRSRPGCTSNSELTGHGEERIIDEEEMQYMYDTKCKICLRRESDVVFLPCRHLVCCRVCANDCQVCIDCDKTILETKKIYR